MTTFIIIMYAFTAIGMAWALYKGVCKADKWSTLLLSTFWPMTVTIISVTLLFYCVCKLIKTACNLDIYW